MTNDEQRAGVPSVKIPGCVADTMILEIYRCIPRMQTQLEHIAERLDTTVKRLDSLELKVDNLTDWKSRILGGMATVAFLFAGYKLVADHLTVSLATPNSALSVTQPQVSGN